MRPLEAIARASVSQATAAVIDGAAAIPHHPARAARLTLMFEQREG